MTTETGKQVTTPHETSRMTAWKAEVAEKEKKKKEEAALKTADRVLRAPMDDIERAAQVIAKREAEPIPEFNLEYNGNTMMVVDPEAIRETQTGTSRVPEWTRDGSYPDAVNYGYIWHPVDLIEEKMQQTLDLALTDAGRSGSLPEGQLPQHRIWYVCNRSTLTFLKQRDVEPHGMVTIRASGQLFALLTCRRSLFDLIYGKTHTKEELRAGARDVPSLSGILSAEKIGRVAMVPDELTPSGKQRYTGDVKQGLSAEARAGGAFTTILMDTPAESQGGHIKVDTQTGEYALHTDKAGFPGVIVSDRPQDLPTILQPQATSEV